MFWLASLDFVFGVGWIGGLLIKHYFVQGLLDAGCRSMHQYQTIISRWSILSVQGSTLILELFMTTPSALVCGSSFAAKHMKAQMLLTMDMTMIHLLAEMAEAMERHFEVGI